MLPIEGEILVWISHFALILTRHAAVFTVSPVLGRANVPNMTKIMLSVMLTFVILPLHPPPAVMPFPTMYHFLFAMFGELAVGLILGFLNTLFFSIVFTTGQMIDTQIGFGMVQVYDVQSNIQIPVVGSLFNLVVLLTFLVSNGHIKLIYLLSRTFETIPVGQASFSVEIVPVIVESFARSFALAVNIALPIVAAGLLAEISLGIIVRTAPQMNVFVVGIPIKIIIGLAVLALVVPLFVAMTGRIFDEMFAAMDSLFGVMAVT